MRSPFKFIVKPDGGRYRNTIRIGDVDLITSTSQEDHTSSNRIAIVQEVPVGYNGLIEKGDRLIVHHNVFRFYYDMKGRQRSGRSHLIDDLFLLDEDQFFLVGKGDNWFSVAPYCFVRPVESKSYYISKQGGYEPLTGVVVYTNDQLASMGVFAGSTVCFTPHSEYEFVIDGVLYYRMKTNDIAIVLEDEYQGTETANH
jgi:hypothetical protein